MTGYGRREMTDDNAHFVIEIRSLNNRYLDIQIKSPRSLAALEARIRKTVQERFSRGRFDLNITRNGEYDRNGRLAVNEMLAEQYLGALQDLKTRFNLRGDVDLSMLVGFQDVISVAEVKEDTEAQWQTLSTGLAQALNNLDQMRREEGSALALDILARLSSIEGLIAKIQVKAPATVESARKRMMETLGKLLNEQPDPVRIAQEIAILAERTDITEELTRLGSHIVQFRALLGGSDGDAVGRKLDFLIQEIGREVNTIASKAMNAEVSMDVVNIKAELEKIREQVQNIE
jgi:uncharacterized protein (TIGR00255 family)